ncbi:MAG: diheme cytochrome c [Betaproteobacteria bacterium]
MKTQLAKLLAISLLALLNIGAQADDGFFGGGGKYHGEDRGKPVLPTQSNATWQQECSACHMAFAPSLLPAASWTRLLAGLDKHFGADASLSPAQASEISAFLTKQASNRWTAKSAPLRITEAAWFKSKHNEREVPLKAWSRPSVKGAWNCSACHAGADSGDFNERGVRIPK